MIHLQSVISKAFVGGGRLGSYSSRLIVSDNVSFSNYFKLELRIIFVIVENWNKATPENLSKEAPEYLRTAVP